VEGLISARGAVDDPAPPAVEALISAPAAPSTIPRRTPWKH
jgi:hypothetical protein